MGPVDREQVLREVVGSDREEIRVRREARRADRRGRCFDHDADRNAGIAVHGRGKLADHLPHGFDFGDVVDHRKQDLAAAGRAQRKDRGELRAQELRLPEARANAAQAQRRIVLGRHREKGNRLVAARVQRSHDNGPARERIHHFLVLPCLLRGIRRLEAIEKQELGAEQPASFRARSDGSGCLRGRAHVGQYFDALAVRRAAVERGRRAKSCADPCALRDPRLGVRDLM